MLVEVEVEVEPEVVFGLNRLWGVTWLGKGAQGGTRVKMEGGRVATETFVSPGSSPVETLSSGLLIQHQGITAPGS